MNTETGTQNNSTMNNRQTTIISSRLGPREISLDRVLTFPRGIVGFENMRDFTLLQITEGAPLLVLQSMEEPALGLLVADPYVFLPDYKLCLGDVEQLLLKAQTAGDLAVLVTVSIPPGKPEETALNLLGPILINHHERLGLQVPQMDGSGPAKYYIKDRPVDMACSPAAVLT